MAIDWQELYKNYKGLWVALMDDEKTVVASGKTAKAAYDQAIASGQKEPILTKVPTSLSIYVG